MVQSSAEGGCDASLRGGHRVALLRSAHGPPRTGHRCCSPRKPPAPQRDPGLPLQLAVGQVAGARLHQAQRDSRDLCQHGRRCPPPAPGSRQGRSAPPENRTSCAGAARAVQKARKQGVTALRRPRLLPQEPPPSVWIGLALVGFASVGASHVLGWLAPTKHRVAVSNDKRCVSRSWCGAYYPAQGEAERENGEFEATRSQNNRTKCTAKNALA